MIHSVFFMSNTGMVLIEKHYRGFLNRSIADTFWKEVSARKAPKETPPVLQSDKYVLAHVQHADLFVLSVIDDEMPALMAIDMMYRCLDIFKQYFGAVNADTLRKHFAIVYQLMDEVLDNGLPFNTEVSLLKEVISPPSFTDSIPLWTRKKNAVLPTWGADTSGAQVLWRKRGIKHTTNEIYLDVTEFVDAILDSNGKPVAMEVFGEVTADVSLSDMPDLTMVFKNSRVIGDVGLHSCVRYKRWESERVVSFVPPEGSFQLMTYRVREGVVLPIYVQPQIHFNRDGGSVSLMVGVKPGVTDKTVECRVTIPFSTALGTSKIDMKANYGKVAVDETAKTVVWDIGKLPRDGSVAPHLEGKIHLATGVPLPDGGPAIAVEWHCTGFLCSGLEFDSLNVASVDYSPFKGVKTMSRHGRFEVRSSH